MHELKLLVDMMHEGGMGYMRYSISETAEYGDYTRGPKIIDDHVRQNMKQVLQNIRSGAFAREWILENQAGQPSFKALRRQNNEHMIETVGADLRSMMPWLKAGKPSANPQPTAPVAPAAPPPAPEPQASSLWTKPAPAPTPEPTPPSTPSPWSSNPGTPPAPSDGGSDRWGGTQ
jgi:hypothetical protein